MQYEQKRNKNELNVPNNPINDDSREIITSEYSYRYFTLSIIPRVSLDRNKRFTVALGGYVSKIKQVQGYNRTHNLRDNSIDEGSFEARLFRDLRNDGAVYSFIWMPGLTGIEDNDFGATLAVGYSIPFRKNQRITIELIVIWD